MLLTALVLNILNHRQQEAVEAPPVEFPKPAQAGVEEIRVMEDRAASLLSLTPPGNAPPAVLPSMHGIEEFLRVVEECREMSPSNKVVDVFE